ncbi:hypothetical protein NHP164001_19410 [Helicobacter trogontum]|uniref:Uncharacterized protein n=1 Tax=Helicobacter trogontum TaxID=50960 RepID=A0ABQ0D6Z8_9HELI
MQDFLYELGYHHDEDLDCVADNIISLKQKDNNINIIRLQDSDIDSLTKDSPLYLLRALYTCKPFAICNENNESFITKENVSKIPGYKSDFANIFVYGKVSLSDTYLQARKALYKSIMQLKDERLKEYQKERNKISQLSYEKYTQEQKEKQRQERIQAGLHTNCFSKQDSMILESNDKNITIIFLDKLDSHLDSANSQNNQNAYQQYNKNPNLKSSNTLHISMSNLIHIHDSKIDIFIKDNTTLDIQELESLITNYKQRYAESNNTEYSNQESHIDYNQESKLTLDSLYSSNTQIFLYSQLLLGSKESPNNPLFFGELDKEGVFVESKPIYHLIGEIDSNFIESTSNNRDSNNSISTLQVFLGSNTLTLLNYSLLDSSLNAFYYKSVYNA